MARRTRRRFVRAALSSRPSPTSRATPSTSGLGRTRASPRSTPVDIPETATRHQREGQAASACTQKGRRQKGKGRTPQAIPMRLPSALCLLPSFPQQRLCLFYLLLDLATVDLLAVAGERALPRRDRVGGPMLLLTQVAQMILDDRVLRQPIRRRRQGLIGEIEVPLLHVRPAQAVEIGRVGGIDFQRALNERDGLVEVTAALREHVAEIVQRVGVERVVPQQIAERFLGFDLLPAAIVRGAELIQDARVVRKSLLRRGRRRDRVPEPARFGVALDQQDLPQRIVRRKLRRLLERGDGLVMLLQSLQREPLGAEEQRDAGARVRVAAALRDLRLEQGDGLLVTVARLENLRQHVKSADAVRLRLLELTRRRLGGVPVPRLALRLREEIQERRVVGPRLERDLQFRARVPHLAAVDERRDAAAHEVGIARIDLLRLRPRLGRLRPLTVRVVQLREADHGAIERRLLADDGFQRIDRVVGMTGFLLRLREQQIAFAEAGLIVEDVAEERRGLPGGMVLQIQTREREVGVEIDGAVAPRD